MGRDSQPLDYRLNIYVMKIKQSSIFIVVGASLAGKCEAKVVYRVANFLLVGKSEFCA